MSPAVFTDYYHFIRSLKDYIYDVLIDIKSVRVHYGVV